MRLGTDSGDYAEILGRCAQFIELNNVPGLSLELGLREGGGTQYMIEQYASPRTHIAIDPYGSLPYEWQENTIASWVYDNQMRNHAVSSLFHMTNRTNVNFVFLNLTDQDYFDRFVDGYPTFVDGKRELIDKYAIVHLDAVHAIHAIENQINFFLPRISVNGIIVFDDVQGFYDHSTIEIQVLERGFVKHLIGSKKASYRKVHQ